MNKEGNETRIGLACPLNLT